MTAGLSIALLKEMVLLQRKKWFRGSPFVFLKA